MRQYPSMAGCYGANYARSAAKVDVMACAVTKVYWVTVRLFLEMASAATFCTPGIYVVGLYLETIMCSVKSKTS